MAVTLAKEYLLSECCENTFPIIFLALSKNYNDDELIENEIIKQEMNESVRGVDNYFFKIIPKYNDFDFRSHFDAFNSRVYFE